LSHIKIINKRTSVRSFSEEELAAELLQKIEVIVTKERTGLFGSNHKLSLIDTNDNNLKGIGKMTSYGVIKGASLYFGGYSEPDDKSIIDFGFCFQEALLELTALGLGTCWLGGTFGRGFIAKALSLPDGKVIPAISPVGIGLEKRTITDKLVRKLAGSAKRKPHDKLFFNYSENNGLMPMEFAKGMNSLSMILKAVRIAPSASNKQPWRIVVQDNYVHLYWDVDEKYNKGIKNFKIQALDMGIALCHLMRSSDELNINGTFSENDPKFDEIKWKYIASWKIDKSPVDQKRVNTIIPVS